MLENLSDTDLLVAADAEMAFSIIYNRYWEPLYKKALTRFGDSADAQDAVQEVFISLWRNRHSIDASNTLSPYLFAALKYHIIKKVYRRARQGWYVPLSVKMLEQNGAPEDSSFQLKELQSVILTELDHLPVRMRQVYDLSRGEHLRTVEIARRLNISEQTVKNTLSTALKRLRERLAHYSNSLFF